MTAAEASRITHHLFFLFFGFFIVHQMADGWSSTCRAFSDARIKVITPPASHASYASALAPLGHRVAARLKCLA